MSRTIGWQRTMKALAFVAIIALKSQLAAAWDGTPAGVISNTDVTTGTNFAFRIGLVGVSPMCTGGAGLAYLNEADSNYQAYVAALMMAKALVYSNLDGTGNCHIGYVSVAG